MRLILASTSPRRRDLLKQLGLIFEVVAPRFEEKFSSRLGAAEALHLARQKGLSVAALYPKALILASDTLVQIDQQKLGNPANEAEAVAMLRLLSGKTHAIFTAVVLLNTETQEIKEHVEEAQVTFRDLSAAEIQAYVQSGEPFGKAGAYAIQGKGEKLIASLVGDKNAVIGLALEPIKKWLGL